MVVALRRQLRRRRAAAQHHGRLEGGGPPVGSVGAGAIRRPLPYEEQRLPALVQLHLEELVLLVRELDAQQPAAVRGGHVLLGTYLPAALVTALPLSGTVEQLGCGLILGRDARLGHLEDQLGGACHFARGVPLSVVSRRPEGEGWLGAAGVSVVPVDALPRVLTRLKGEVPGEKEDVGTGLTMPADPATG